MRILDEPGLDFDDVWLVPKRGTLNSRSQVNLVRTLKPLHGLHHWDGLPIIISNMDNTGTTELAKAANKHGVYAALHKFYDADVLIDFFRNFSSQNFYTTGIRKEDLDKLNKVHCNVKLNCICVDAPNAYIPNFLKACDYIRKIAPNSFIMAGNCATPNLVEELILNHGVDCAKLFIGPGSHCLTRPVTGVYVPTFTATAECADAAHGVRGYVCADGGFKNIGDFAKAFGAGADFCMSGSFFVGCEESGLDENWERSESGEKIRLRTYGMSSDYSQKKYYGKQESYRASEGKVEWQQMNKGPVVNIINEIKGGLASTATYIGASQIKDFPKCATFIRKG